MIRKSFAAPGGYSERRDLCCLARQLHLVCLSIRRAHTLLRQNIKQARV